MATSIQAARLSAHAHIDEVARALHVHGYAIVEALAPELTRDAAHQLGPWLGNAQMCEGDFTGRRTQRVGRLIARSPACAALARHPLTLGAVEQSFLGSSDYAQLSLTQAIAIHAGQAAQSLHRDDNVYGLGHPRPPAVINTMWALSDFRADNGATRIVPGSHRWDDQRRPEPEEVRVAEMPAGSVLLWDGALYHGGGSHRSGAPRLGAVLTYNLAWLRQVENQYLAVPPELARTYSREMQQLLGYANHGFLGTHENHDPRDWLAHPAAAAAPPRDLYGERQASVRTQRY